MSLFAASRDNWRRRLGNLLLHPITALTLFVASIEYDLFVQLGFSPNSLAARLVIPIENLLALTIIVIDFRRRKLLGRYTLTTALYSIGIIGLLLGTFFGLSLLGLGIFAYVGATVVTVIVGVISNQKLGSTPVRTLPWNVNGVERWNRRFGILLRRVRQWIPPLLGAIITLTVLFSQWGTWFSLIAAIFVGAAISTLTFATILKHPRLTIIGYLLGSGLIILVIGTPVLGPYLSPQPSSTGNNRLIFSVLWLPLNNSTQSVDMTFDAVANTLYISFVPNTYSLHYKTGLLWIAEPFTITGRESGIGNWTWQQQCGACYLSGLQGAGWQILLNYTYHVTSGYTCSVCYIVLDTGPIVQPDLQGLSAIDLPYFPEKNGAVGFVDSECPQNDCLITGVNMTTNVSVVLPHDASTLTYTPSASGTSVDPKATSLTWSNLNSTIIISYISALTALKNQFFLVTASILVSTGVAMFADWAAKRLEERDNRIRDEQAGRRFSTTFRRAQHGTFAI